MAKKYHPLPKIFNKLANGRLVDNLCKCDLFYQFQYGYNSQLTTDLQQYLIRACNRSGATWAVTVDKFKTFNRLFKSYEIKTRYMALFCFLSVIDSCESGCEVLDRVVLDGKFQQEYPVNARVPEGHIFGSMPFLLYIKDLINIIDEIICDIAIYDDNTTR